MISYLEKRQKTLPYRILSAFIAFTFAFSLVLPPGYAQVVPAVLNLPAPGTMVGPSAAFTPALINGITIHPENPLEFDFIVGTGDEKLQGKAFEDESTRLIKYFLAALTVPEDQMWVNLSPYEKDRIVPQGFGTTEMGRDLLAQDYILKQLTASLMYPEKELGSAFWKKIYQKAYEQYGTTEIPMNTFNKVWIVPRQAVVYEHGNSAFVVKSHLKVMLEEDYLASGQRSVVSGQSKNLNTATEGSPQEGKHWALGTEIIREIILPEIEKEVNEGQTFANLRQIYNSVILAAWFKQNLRQTLLGQVYVDKARTKGVDVEDKEINQKIYAQYLEAFKKGVYNYIREDTDPATKEVIPRKYFSGGTNLKVGDVVETYKNGRPLSNLQQQTLEGFLVGQSSDQQKININLLELSGKTSLADVEEIIASSRGSAKKSSSPVETPQYGIQKQKDALAKALKSPENNYYDAVFLVVDEQSYLETQDLVKELRGSIIPEGSNIIIVRQPKGKIKGNWSALINILMDSEHWDRIDSGAYSNMAVILSAGTGSRNYPLTATGYGDKGKQAAPNGRTYIEQQFKQVMQYYEQDHKGMVIVSNDGIKSLSKEITLGEQGVQFMGSQLPILSSQLDGFGTADVESSETGGKPIRAFNEKATLINRIMAYYRAATPGEAEKVIKDIKSGKLEEKLIPTNWADYNLTLKALSEIHKTYGELRDTKGQLLYLKYGLDTGGDLFESTTIGEEVYVAGKVKRGWGEDDAHRLWDTATALRKKFGFGYVSTGTSAIFFDTGSNQAYAEVAQQLLTNKDLRNLLDIPEPKKGSIIGPNVVFGRGVKVENGVVALGTVVINKGHLKSGAVVINSALKELYAEGGSLTYNVEELEDPVYVNEGYLVSDVFFKRKMRLVPKNIQRGNQKLFTLITVDSHLEMGYPRVIGGVVIENGEIVKKPTGIDFEIPQKGDEVVDQAKIRVNMPLYLSAKDAIQEYDLISKNDEVFAHIITVNGIVRGYFPLDEGVENSDELENVIGSTIKHDLTVISKDDLLYNVKPIGSEHNLWELKNLPRKITNENQPVSPRLEYRENRVSFAELAHWADGQGTRDFLKIRLPGYLELKEVAALPKTTASSPVTIKEVKRTVIRMLSGNVTQAAELTSPQREELATALEDEFGISISPEEEDKFKTIEDVVSLVSRKVNAAASSPVTSDEFTKGGIDLNPAFLDLQIKRDANGIPLPLPMQPIKDMHIEGFLPIIINVTPITNLPLLLGLADTKQDTDETRPAMKAREPELISALN